MIHHPELDLFNKIAKISCFFPVDHCTMPMKPYANIQCVYAAIGQDEKLSKSFVVKLLDWLDASNHA
jgi:hypothetical protein